MINQKIPQKNEAVVDKKPNTQIASAQNAPVSEKKTPKNAEVKKKPKKKIRPDRKTRIKDYLEKAGIMTDIKNLYKPLFKGAIALNLLISLYFIYHFSVSFGISWSTIVLSIILIWTVVLGALIFLSWLTFYVVVDIKTYRRKLEVEEVLPDFLQLTASNITAGMTIDRALFFAVRPRFGVLAKEIEMIAKATMSGAELKTELEKFGTRYDSQILRRSIAMLNEGIDAGGKIGDLLNRIALDIQEQRSILKEMAASVTTYVIFIGFATVVAAPMLFALSGVLIQVVSSLSSSVGSSIKVASGMGLPFSFSGSGVTIGNFKIFASLSLILSSTFSAMMISTIKKGNIKHGIKYIPIFIFISLTLYFVVQSVGAKVIGVFF